VLLKVISGIYIPFMIITAKRQNLYFNRYSGLPYKNMCKKILVSTDIRKKKYKKKILKKLLRGEKEHDFLYIQS
jgi:hypothetical protein